MDVLASSQAWVNSTVAGLINPATTAWAADLYQGTDVTQLNWAERAWMDWYLYWGNPVLATGVMSFVLHEVSCDAGSGVVVL